MKKARLVAATGDAPKATILHDASRITFGSESSQLKVVTEDDFDDGRRAFVYVVIDVTVVNAKGRKTRVPATVRFYNDAVHTRVADMEYDNCGRVFAAFAPSGSRYDGEPAFDEIIDEASAFERGYVPYDIVADWLHLGEERTPFPTDDDADDDDDE